MELLDEPSNPLSSNSKCFKYVLQEKLIILVYNVLQEKLIILVLVKKAMMEIKLVKMKLKLLFH